LLRPTAIGAACIAAAAALLGCAAAQAAATAQDPLDFEVREGLNINCLRRDASVAAHLVLRSGKRPRILVAFPAGDSGVGLWFAPLAAPASWEVVAGPQPQALVDPRGRPLYGISARVRIATPELKIEQAVLSSVRVLRDYQALGTIPPRVAAAPFEQGPRIRWERDRIDGAAGYRLTVEVLHGALHDGRIRAGDDGGITLAVTAASGEAPLTPLPVASLLTAAAAPDPASRNALAFLSYREKLLAGSWRFDTYFGRDTLISLRLLMPALSGQAMEAGLGALLRRLSDRGEVAHEEDIGEFAILDHLRSDGSMSDAPVYDYGMIDGDYLLAPVAAAWLLDDERGRRRAASFLAGADGRGAGRPARFGDDLVANLNLVASSTAPFAQDPQAAHLIGLKPGRATGEWRDSRQGLGGGRYPYDVNAALVPAALEAAARLAASGLLDPYLSAQQRALLSGASDAAKVWREQAPRRFEVRLRHEAAVAAIKAYAASEGVPAQPALAALEPGEVRFHAVALDASGAAVPVMNSDEGFALLFGEPGPQALQQAVGNATRPFPAGLMTPVGMVVANPVFCAPQMQAGFDRHAYHGTVVWSWQQALLAAGLQRQLQRTDLPGPVRAQLLQARKTLWAAIEASHEMIDSELWSWSYSGGRYRIAPFGQAQADADESNAVQLWSTVFLALHPPGRGEAP
jgi:hypothetical protein